jgi:hypothetical protein
MKVKIGNPTALTYTSLNTAFEFFNREFFWRLVATLPYHYAAA